MNSGNDATIITAPPTTDFQGPMLVGPDSSLVTCVFCHASVQTAVTHTDNSGTHIAAALWGRLCCLCCMPYCSEDCKNTDHYCPNCEKYLGTYRRF